MFFADIVTVRLLLFCAVLSIAVIWGILTWQRKQKSYPQQRIRGAGPLFGDEYESEEDASTIEETDHTSEKTDSVSDRTEPKNSKISFLKKRFQKPEQEEPASTPKVTKQPKPEEKLSSDDRNVIYIELRARKREGFSGKSMEAIFHRFHLTFGDMGIYHRQIRVGQKTDTSFSVLNGKEPGTLRPEDMEAGISTVIFFIQTQNCSNPLRSFGEMTDVARQCARYLDGLLYDDLGSNLTEQTLRYYCEKIKERMLAKRTEEARNKHGRPGKHGAD